MPHYNSKTIIECILTEPINLQNAIKLRDNWDKIIPTLSIDRQDKINNPKNGLDPLKAIKKIVKDGITSIRTSYKYSANLKKSGRLYSTNGVLQGIARELRAILQSNQYDVDIINCHPVLLSQLCKKHNIPCPILNDYVENRDEHIERIANDMHCDFGDVKHSILSVLNGAIRDGFTDRFFIDFKNEIRDIHIQLKDFYPDKYKTIKSKKDFNELGSLMNVLLCEIENEILIHAYNFMTEQGYTITTFVFDGFMLDKDKDITDEIFKQLSDYIKDKTNYRVQYVIKDFDDTIDLSKYDDNNDDDMSIDIKNLRPYEEVRVEFEKTHLKIRHPPMIITTKDKEFHYQSIKSFGDSYMDLQYLSKDKKGNFIEKQFVYDWLKDKNIRCYDECVFIPPPLRAKPNQFNTWTPFDIESIDLENTERDYWAEFCEYMKNLFQNEAVVALIKARWAYRLKNPAFRTKICLIITGNEGDGKNRLLEVIYKIFGDKYTQSLDNAKKLYDTHSTFEKEKLWLCINEAGGCCNFENSETLKTRITESKLSINPKGIQPFTIDLLCDYDMTTNNRNVVKLTEDSTRRFIQVETTSYYRGNSDFFNDYSKNICDNPQALRQIYEGLINFDVDMVIPSGNFQTDKPTTKIEEEVKKQNRDKLMYFIEYIMEQGIEKYDNKILFNEFKAWCSDNNIKLEQMNSVSFGIKMTHLINNKINKVIPNAIKKNSSNNNTRFNLDLLKEYFNKLNSDFVEE